MRKESLDRRLVGNRQATRDEFGHLIGVRKPGFLTEGPEAVDSQPNGDNRINACVIQCCIRLSPFSCSYRLKG